MGDGDREIKGYVAPAGGRWASPRTALIAGLLAAAALAAFAPILALAQEFSLSNFGTPFLIELPYVAVGFLVAFFVVGRLVLPEWSSEWVAGLAVVLFIPFTPLVTRYSRVLWIHYDRWAWPGADFLGPPG